MGGLNFLATTVDDLDSAIGLYVVSPITLDVVWTTVCSMMATSKETKRLSSKLVGRKSVLFQSMK